MDDTPTPLPSQYFYIAFSAPPRSGKTSTALSLLTTKNSGKRKIYPCVKSVINCELDLNSEFYESYDLDNDIKCALLPCI